MSSEPDPDSAAGPDPTAVDSRGLGKRSSLTRLNAALAGRYALREEAGSGASATVYIADDVRHGRQVAVKVFRPEVASALGPDRFRREIEIAARLSHPHILPLHDSGEAEGFLFYVMPYVTGGSLRRRLEREQRLSLDVALDVARQVSAALAHAHARGVIHRDIKPENILLQEEEALVADFGIAVAAKEAGVERITETGQALGTPEYMSPEQALGEGTVDARTDQYGLACVLYELLAGEPPYVGRTARAVLTKRLVDPIPSIRRLRQSVPLTVERALMKAMAADPADRFASVAAFAEALTAPTPIAPSLRPVAILPFLNLSPDPDNEYLADGFTEDVIAQVSKVGGLRVISRTSVMPFKKRELSLRQIGARLEAATLLDGSVRRAGDRVRIVAQLVDAETDEHLWAETYDRQLTDIFAIQADVALRIAAALETELSPSERTRIRREPTRDLQAYQFYLQGRSCFIRYTPESLRRSAEHFERAVARDPGYALAHVGLALAYVELAETGVLPPDEPYARAREAASRAIELDPELAEAHSVLAVIRCVRDFDWAGAERDFQRALDLNPSAADTFDYYGRMLSALGRHDEAILAQRRAHELDPLAHPLDLATALLRAGRSDEALEIASRSVELDPDSARAHATVGWARIQLGRTDEGLTELEKATEITPGSSMWLAQLGQGYAVAGRMDDARETLLRLEEMSREAYVAPYHLAYVHTGLGEFDAAIDCLERAYEERAGAVYGIKGSFLFASLHSHPRFRALLERMNLV